MIQRLHLCVISLLLTTSIPLYAADKPSLVVVISIDQMRRDRLDRQFPGGIGKILQGRNFVESQLDHGITNTCPGHVVLLTGANPSTAGVPGNSFIDRKTFQGRYCVDDDNESYRLLDGDEMRSPRNIRVTSLGDWMKLVDASSRVFSIGGKDRSTIAMGGQKPDGAFWYNRNTGNFTTSGYYATQLPEYISAFNGKVPEVDGALARLPEFWEHESGQFRVDDYEGESEKYSRVSGHPLRSGEEIYDQIYYSPYVDKLTLNLAAIVAEQEKLGEDGSTDLLAIALSATDTVGHGYGPRSAEAIDALNKADLWLGELLDTLEAKLGKDQLLVVLSADHGVAELPEYRTETKSSQCPEQDRISASGFIASLYWNVYRKWTFPFTRPDDLVVFGGSSFTINANTAKELNLDVGEVTVWLDQHLASLPIVETAWTRDEIRSGQSEVARLLRNSLVPDRSGDVVVQLKEDCVITSDAGTTHGSVYHYDRDVPMVFYGWGVAAGNVGKVAHTVDIGPSLANHLGIAMPEGLDGRVLSLVDKAVDTND
jgi:predicted AlkP superfamily pyrophosphatase or phosphodiesterase